MSEKIRLDQLVFDLGYTDSREKAKAIIMSGNVFVDGKRISKAGEQINPNSNIEIKNKDLPFVSRGGYKLDKAIKVFNISCKDKICIDCGASTGGFTDVLLQYGAKKVYSVDVGYGQLAWKLRNDKRVINMERTNIRYISSNDITESLDLAVCDVSFISIKLVLPAVVNLLKNDSEIICLIKPQFEAGKDLVGKKGVVKESSTHINVINGILDFIPSIGLSLENLDYSPIKGPEGNIEFLCHLRKGVSNKLIDVDNIVKLAHEALSV